MDKYRLLSIMAGKGITQTKLSQEIRMSKNSLSEKINGKRKFNSDEIIAICNALAINDNDIKAQIFLS